MKRIPTSFIAIALTLVSLNSEASEKSFSFNEVASQPLLTTKDFTRAKLVSREGKSILQMTLTEEAMERFKNYSLNHLGQKIAIMEDGDVLATPTVRSLVSRSFEIDALSAADAKRLVEAIGH